MYSKYPAILLHRVPSGRWYRNPHSYTVSILDEYQPSVSNLLKGRISQVSVEKPLRYADRLHLETSIAVRPMESRGSLASTRKGAARTRRWARKTGEGDLACCFNFSGRGIEGRSIRHTCVEGCGAGVESAMCLWIYGSNDYSS
jgi:hypothetical protein